MKQGKIDSLAFLTFYSSILVSNIFIHVHRMARAVSFAHMTAFSRGIVRIEEGRESSYPEAFCFYGMENISQNSLSQHPPISGQAATSPMSSPTPVTENGGIIMTGVKMIHPLESHKKFTFQPPLPV